MPFDPITYSILRKIAKIPYYMIQSYRSLDPSSVCIHNIVEQLVRDGKLTVSDVALFANSVEDMFTLWAINYCWRTSFTAAVFNDPNITVSKVVSILSNVSLSVAHSILAEPSISGDRVKAILYSMVENKSWKLLLDIITYTASDVTVSANTTVTGTVRYKNLTINSGVTLTVDGQPGVIIANTITNNGSIVKTATGGAGGSGVTGGRGGGGLIIVAKTVSGGTYTANATSGANGYATGISGGAGGAGSFIVVGSDAPGAGGAGGYNLSYTPCYGSGRHGGGGGSNNYCGGSGGSASLATYNTYTDIAVGILKATVDYYIRSVLGKTLSSTTPFPNVYGAGGGGGGSGDGGGGGGGGQIIVVADTVSGGSFTVAGGNGGAGSTVTGVSGGGGGGGGGGIVYVLALSFPTAPSVSAPGGAGGAGATGASSGASGTAGTAKYVVV